MNTKTLIMVTAVAAAVFASNHTFADHHNEQPNIVETVQSAGQFNTFIAVAKAADLVGALTGDGRLTVFAPTDDAFAALPAGTVEDLLKPENKAKLAAVLTHHVVAGDVFATEAIKAGGATTLQGEAVVFSIREGRLFVNESGVLANDDEASYGGTIELTVLRNGKRRHIEVMVDVDEH